ncbi:MAG: PA14 domain-containing protein [Pseudomonadota bacterium]
MKTSFLKLSTAAVGFVLLAVLGTSYGEDYLIIRKKSGETQKVPLRFTPEEIESFQVEPGSAPPAPQTREPGKGTGSGEAAETGEATRPDGEFEEKAPPEVTRPKPLPAPPQSRPQQAPLIMRPEAERQPSDEPPPDLKTGKKPTGPRKIEQTAKPAGPVPVPTDRNALGSFLVNVYKLPDNVKAIPDYSAFQPEKVLASDKVNLQADPAGREPAGVPEGAPAMGMRFLGLFRVTGEGIFQWRVNAKDGVRLHVDDKTIIENDGVHPAESKSGFVHLGEGVHVVVLDSFNASGQPLLQLLATPPGGKEEVFSISKGLAGWSEPEKPYDVLWGQVYFVPKGQYPDGPDFSKISPVGRLTASELKISGGDIPGLPGRKDMVGIRYEGYFNVKGAGIFAFRLLADEFAALTIGKHEIAKVVGGLKKKPEGDVGWAFLQEGSYPITLQYFHPSGEPRLELYVTQPTSSEQVFSPSQTLNGFAADSGKMSMIPAFVYFLKPGTKKLPNFNQLSPSGMFFTKSIDYPTDRGSREFPGIPLRHEWLGIRFYVKFSLSEQESGAYGFRVLADDGARLIVGKKLVVNADGHGGIREGSGTVQLNAGTHEMFMDYYTAEGKNGIQLFITPPGGTEKVFAFQ